MSLEIGESATMLRSVQTALMPACSTGAGAMLRAFERLRGERPIDVCGDEGMFPGYNTIVFALPVHESRGLIHLSAELIKDFSETHNVDFVATEHVAVASGESPPKRLVEVARGRIRTLRLHEGG